MSLRHRSSGFIAAYLLLGAAFTACGGLSSGEIVIVDDAATAGKKSGAAGSSNTQGGDNSAGSPDAVVAGAGGAGDTAGTGPIVVSNEPPTVVAITPEDRAVKVEPTTTVSIEFSESLDPDSVEGAVTITDGKRELGAEVEVTEGKVVLTLDARLDLLATYTVNVSTAVTDLEGEPLAEAFSASFQVRDGAWGGFTQISNALGKVLDSRYPSPVFDAQGNGLVVWPQSAAKAGSLSAIWGRFYRPGEGWQPSFLISAATTACRFPSVSINSAGDAVVAWVQDEATFDRVYARRYLAGAWEAKPLRLDVTDSTSVPSVTAALTETGDAHVLWQYFSTYDYVAGNHAVGAGPWKASDTYITGAFDSLSGPAVSFSADGSGFAIWGLTSGATTAIRVSRYLTASGWGTAATLAGSATATVTSNAPPTILVDASGGAMAAWHRGVDVATNRFTKAAGWGAAVPADSGGGAVTYWSPRLARNADDFWVMWQQDVGGIRNAFANRYTAGAWAAQPSLLSDGDTTVHEWSETGFGLDRNGNGLAVWVQGSDVRSARLVGQTKLWQADALVQTLEGKTVMEALTGVAENGIAASIYCTGYPYYENHEAIFGAVFE